MGNKTCGNWIRVKLDPENNFIETKSGFKLYLDTSYEEEKHIQRTGVVEAIPSKLIYNKDGSGMPWKTSLEIKEGDIVLMYYLAVQNCLRKEYKRYIKEGNRFTIFIEYQNIYGVIRDGKVIPINGYCFIEHHEDPDWEEMIAKAEKSNLVLPDLRELSKKNVSYGTVAYIGKPNEEYFDSYKSDKGYDLKVGDKVIMKKVTDIMIENPMHAKLDKGRKLYRAQRHRIVAKI